MQPQFIELPEMKMIGFGANFIPILSPGRPLQAHHIRTLT